MRRRDVLKAAAGTLGLAAWPLAWATAAEDKKKRILYFTRSVGFEHSPVKRNGKGLSLSDRVLTEMGRRAGFAVECTKDGRVFDGDLSGYDAIALYTCGNLTQPGSDGDPPMTARGKERLIEAVAAGKGLIGLHSATVTLPTSAPSPDANGNLDPYVAMLGGEFVAHGAEQEASLIIASRFPGAGEIGCSEGISFTDEWYAMKNFAKDLHVILVQETQYLQGNCYRRPNYPATWARMHGKGRVFYTSLGHRDEIWTNPFFQAIAMGGISWVLGRAQFDVKPNIDKVAPQANQLSEQA